MGLFSRTPYHFPHFQRLGKWEWDEKRQSWTLNLSKFAHELVGFGVARAFSQFNDDRVEFNGAMDFSSNEFLGGWITIKGKDGRTYFAERLDIHWRVFMNRGKRFTQESSRPYDIDKIPFVTENVD
jgi:hypothetical protein